MTSKLPDPYDPSCQRYARDMVEIDGFWADSWEEMNRVPEEERPAKRAAYAREDGTYNPSNGHFLCDRCYIAAGQPSSPTGWTCP